MESRIYYLAMFVAIYSYSYGGIILTICTDSSIDVYKEMNLCKEHIIGVATGRVYVTACQYCKLTCS